MAASRPDVLKFDPNASITSSRVVTPGTMNRASFFSMTRPDKTGFPEAGSGTATYAHPVPNTKAGSRSASVLSIGSKNQVWRVAESCA